MILLLSLALAADPPATSEPAASEPAAPTTDLSALTAMSLTYDVRFDVDATGDRFCKFTKICDCTASYKGEGARPTVDGQRVTFEGRFELVKSDCSDNLTFWVPASGEAFHTLRVDDQGRIIEWVAHRDADKHAALSSKIKEGGQVWLTDMSVPWQPGVPATHTESDEGDLGQGIKLASSHDLRLTLAVGD